MLFFFRRNQDLCIDVVPDGISEHHGAENRENRCPILVLVGDIRPGDEGRDLGGHRGHGRDGGDRDEERDVQRIIDEILEESLVFHLVIIRSPRHENSVKGGD